MNKASTSYFSQRLFSSVPLSLRPRPKTRHRRPETREAHNSYIRIPTARVDNLAAPPTLTQLVTDTIRFLRY
ncbi:hypothetical protein E2C01_072372 [Portunus trituberculatus]|uniref:Uncharacterized protein n=1 Tax=Portunus trituberculatus TaxID=210409 RepID=A0A5B7I6I9_PORTR|nr:hypothetical protein [Portunus trituberculatus]